MKFRKTIFFGIAIVTLYSCGVNSENPEIKKLSNVNQNEYTINILPYDEMPYIAEHVRSFNMNTFDQDSVPMAIFGDSVYYHPVYTSSFGINFVDGAVRDGNPDYLKLAERIARRLVENANETNDKFLFPYNFDFKYTDADYLESPWYSGMAQGRMLTLFSRLYDVTGNKIYLSWADSTFESLKLLRNHNSDEDWVGYIDEDNYYWIEEYPSEEKPVHVLNGFIFAIYGLYDYYLVTDKPEALMLLKASITTIEHYIGEYRNPNGISYYDLKNKFTNEKYHFIHIEQLNMIFKITGEQYFKEMADLLENDYR